MGILLKINSEGGNKKAEESIAENFIERLAPGEKYLYD